MKTMTRFARMTAKYRGKCAQCSANIQVGDDIFYSRPDAYCDPCGDQIFNAPKEPKPEATILLPGDEVIPDAPPSVPAATTTQSTTGFVLTTQKCYCALVKRKCGSCVAK